MQIRIFLKKEGNFGVIVELYNDTISNGGVSYF